MSRTNKVILIAGTRGTGKTDFVKNLLFKMSKTFPKCLVVDTFDSDVWHNLSTWNAPERTNKIPVIPIPKFSRWKSGIGRMYSANTSLIMEQVQEYARNTFIVFEDATKYVGSKLTEDMKLFVLDSKQKNLDLVFIFHSLAAIPPDLVRVADILVLFKTNEGKPSEWKYPWGEIPEMMAKLKASKNRYEHKSLMLN